MTSSNTNERKALMKRRSIRKAELLEICERQNLKTVTESGKPYLKDWLKQEIEIFGKCECGCSRPFMSGLGDIIAKPEYDHVTENSLLFEGDETVWQVLRYDCHKKKSIARAPILAKVRRVARKHGIDRETNPITRKKKEIPSPANHKWPSRPMQTKKNKFTPKVKVID